MKSVAGREFAQKHLEVFVKTNQAVRHGSRKPQTFPGRWLPLSFSMSYDHQREGQKQPQMAPSLLKTSSTNEVMGGNGDNWPCSFSWETWGGAERRPMSIWHQQLILSLARSGFKLHEPRCTSGSTSTELKQSISKEKPGKMWNGEVLG